MGFGNLYKIPFSASLTTNPCDLVGILAPNNSQVVLREFIVGAVSTARGRDNAGIDLSRLNRLEHQRGDHAGSDPSSDIAGAIGSRLDR